jgi:hypothetical protein
MPRFDAQCGNCGKIEEVIARSVEGFSRCKCGGKMEWVPSVRVNVFKPFVHEHLGHKPVRIESWSHYKRILRERNLHNELAD